MDQRAIAVVAGLAALIGLLLAQPTPLATGATAAARAGCGRCAGGCGGC